MEIKEVIEVLTALGLINKPAEQPQTNIVKGKGDKVIVRARDAGVHFGELDYYVQGGREVSLKNSRRLWRWYCNESISLSDVAVNGIKAKDSKIAPVVESIIILDACEIIPCTHKAITSIESAPIASQN